MSAIPKVMLVGVLPPPVHGQSMATKTLFEADLHPIEKVIVGIRSSDKLSKVGKLSLSKALGLIPLIARVWIGYLRHRPRVLYYTAGSGAWIPFIRDIAVLSLCRPLFRRTLIHYHSGNLMEFLESSKFRSLLGKFIYGREAWTIRLGTFCPAPDYSGNRVIEVANGLEAPKLPPMEQHQDFRILFLGNLFVEKGVLDLIEGVRQFATRFPGPVTLSLIGGWPGDDSRQQIEDAISSLPSNVTCPPPAPAYGEDKWQIMAHSDIFVFPSYYRSENLPLVVIEAMAASLPVIACDWRGLKSLVEEGVTGHLVPIRTPSAIAHSLDLLSRDAATRETMGAAGRLRYEAEFTAACYLRSMKHLLSEAAATV